MRYVPDHQGVAALLVAPQMQATMLLYGHQAKGFAESIAATYAETGDYARSFDVEVEIVDGRATAILSNDDPGAATIEWGRRHPRVTEGHHTLSRTVDWIEAER